MENLESVQRDLKNKLLGRIDEVHDDVKQLRQIVDTNLEDIANELMAKNSKVSGVKVDYCSVLYSSTLRLHLKTYITNFNAFQQNSYAIEELKFSVASSEQKLNKEALNPFN